MYIGSERTALNCLNLGRLFGMVVTHIWRHGGSEIDSPLVSDQLFAGDVAFIAHCQFEVKLDQVKKYLNQAAISFQNRSLKQPVLEFKPCKVELDEFDFPNNCAGGSILEQQAAGKRRGLDFRSKTGINLVGIRRGGTVFSPLEIRAVTIQPGDMGLVMRAPARYGSPALFSRRVSQLRKQILGTLGEI